MMTIAFACMGCAGTQPASKPVETAAAAPSRDNGVCDDYADRLCKELGPRTEACQAVLGVVALFPSTACVAGIEAFDTTQHRIAELRNDCDAVAERICSELGQDSQACAAVRGDLPDIPPGQCHALLKDQDRLVAMLQAREAASGPLSDDQWKALTAASAPSFGPPDAAVVLVEFSDFQCPYCGQAAETTQRIKKQYGDRVRFVFRQFPLSFHPLAAGAAQAALAAHEQGKFWEFHDLLFAHQDALANDALLGYAHQLGLDMKSFEAASTSDAIVARVAEDQRLGEGVHVQGTPTLFIDKQRIDNAIDFEGVSQAIEQALDAAK